MITRGDTEGIQQINPKAREDQICESMSQESQAEGIDGTFQDDEPDEWQASLDDSFNRGGEEKLTRPY